MICLMRHGVRLDETDPDATWSDRDARPYDTPLATDAESQTTHAESVSSVFAAVVSSRRSARASTIILSSPYRRCLQTAGMVARRFEIDRIYVDNRLGEFIEAVKRKCSSGEQDLAYVSKEEAEVAAGDGVAIVWDRKKNAMLSLGIVDDVAARAQQIGNIVAEHFVAASAEPGLGDASAASRDAAVAASEEPAAASADGSTGNAAAAPAAVNTAVVVTHGDLCNAFCSPSAVVPDIGQFRFEYTGWVLQDGLERHVTCRVFPSLHPALPKHPSPPAPPDAIVPNCTHNTHRQQQRMKAPTSFVHYNVAGAVRDDCLRVHLLEVYLYADIIAPFQPTESYIPRV